MKRILLGFVPRAPGAGGWAMLRDLCGDDEETVESADTAQAIALLDRLLVPAPEAAVGPGQASTLTASDRDRLLAALFQTEYGTRIDCTLRCTDCGEPFDIDFQLPDLMASLGFGPGASRPAADPDGELRLSDGRRLRLPRGEDELALLGLPPEDAAATLLARCLLDGKPNPDDETTVLDVLEQAAPIIDADLDAVCPECGSPALAHFDLQHYLLTAIAQETPARIAEIHLLARSYGWSLNEILALRRGRRRAFVMAIERDRGVQAIEF
jgi:hypothetical protein